jgi:hypothetical protein
LGGLTVFRLLDFGLLFAREGGSVDLAKVREVGRERLCFVLADHPLLLQFFLAVGGVGVRRLYLFYYYHLLFHYFIIIAIGKSYKRDTSSSIRKIIKMICQVLVNSIVCEMDEKVEISCRLSNVANHRVPSYSGL